MRLNLSEQRDKIRTHLGVDSSDPDFGDVKVNDLINLSYDQVRTRLKLRDIQRFADFTLTAADRESQFAAAYAIYGVLIKDNDTDIFGELFPLNEKEYHASVNDDTDDQRKPTHYYIYDKTTLYFNPVPDEDYTVRVLYLDDAAELSADGDTLRNPAQVDEIVMYGAIWRGFTALNFYEKADAIMAIQDKLISEFVPTQAIEEQDSRYAQLQLEGLQSYNPRGG